MKTPTAEELIVIILKDTSNLKNSSIEYVWKVEKILNVLPELIKYNFQFEIKNPTDKSCRVLTVNI